MSDTVEVAPVPQPAPVVVAAPEPVPVAVAPEPEPVVIPEPDPVWTTYTVGFQSHTSLAIYLDGDRYVINGSGNAAAYGATHGIPAALFDQWLEEHSEFAAVKEGRILILARA